MTTRCEQCGKHNIILSCYFAGSKFWPCRIFALRRALDEARTLNLEIHLSQTVARLIVCHQFFKLNRVQRNEFQSKDFDLKVNSRNISIKQHNFHFENIYTLRSSKPIKNVSQLCSSTNLLITGICFAKPTF